MKKKSLGPNWKYLQMTTESGTSKVRLFHRVEKIVHNGEYAT